MLRDVTAIQVMPTVVVAQFVDPYWGARYVEGQLRYALRESGFIIADKATITSHIVIEEYHGCTREWLDMWCSGSTTAARLVLMNEVSKELVEVPIRVGGGSGVDRTPPMTTAPDDWEYFARVQNELGRRTRHSALDRRLREALASLR